jgi:hypothetical protein
MKPTLIYTLSRIGLLGVCLGLGYLANLRGAILLVAAFLGSGLLSFMLLTKQRSAMGNKIGGVLSTINNRIEANSSKEDID